MSYSGSITILDDDGEVVFEQELNTDQIIEALIASHADEDEGDEEESEKETRYEHLSKVSNKYGVPMGDMRYRVNKEAVAKRLCSNCRQPGHIARNCPKLEPGVGGAEKPEPALLVDKPPKVDNGRLLTEFEFDTVKDLRDSVPMKTSVQILSELPDDVQLQQVNWAILSTDYGAYKRHAEAAG